jgi:ATP-dependent helicase HrpA
MIGHTQPRRLAATSVAQRVAEELRTEIGDWVGYQIRFSERAGPATAIKLMTDGILLAETQRDPLLRRYDTLIIDEAHERSLNIDFLLGFLKRLLTRRKDLKLIITSATIDADRFARHFGAPDRPAPVIQVSGRLFPVELRYRPVRRDDEDASAGRKPGQGDEERDLVDAVVDGVDECARHGAGDVLVFLPGEREIRECAEALRKRHPVGALVLPLYARLSRAEQEQIFHPRGNTRRIVLATNVAETSPGAGHPLRRRQRPGAHQTLFLAQQGRAVAHRADQPGFGQPARRTLRPAGAGRVRAPVRRRGLQGAPGLYGSGDPALVAGLGHFADEIAAAG